MTGIYLHLDQKFQLSYFLIEAMPAAIEYTNEATEACYSFPVREKLSDEERDELQTTIDKGLNDVDLPESIHFGALAWGSGFYIGVYRVLVSAFLCFTVLC